MDIQGWLEFVAERQDVLWLRTGEHLMLAGVSTVIATIFGVTLGILGFKYHKLKGVLLGVVGILQTVPSLALLVFLMALYHKIGVLPALTALILYALLPIVRNTITGLEGVDRPTMEAAEGIGMTSMQRLFMVRIPLSIPVIIAGIRTAAVVGVGVATLAAFIGAGGLGEFINRGLALSNTKLLMLGAVPAALLALVVDFSLAGVEWGLKPISSREIIRSRPLLKTLKRATIAVPAIVLMLSSYIYLEGHPLVSPHGKVAIGTKHFSEHIIMGEMMAQLIEAKTDLKVVRRFDFPGTIFCHNAITSGEIDIYPEYTGTAYSAVLQRKPSPGQRSEEVFSTVQKDYGEKFKLRWLAPFGFNNTYAIVCRIKDADEYGWERVSDLKNVASTLNFGIASEFAERPDGLNGLVKAYNLNFETVSDMDLNLLYNAAKNGDVDIVAANSTDGRIPAYDLKILEDDKKFFPPYEAAPVIRADTLKEFPEIATALESLEDILSDKEMCRLNFEVDGKKRSPKAVAKEFLLEKGLLGEPGETPAQSQNEKETQASLSSVNISSARTSRSFSTSKNFLATSP